MNIKLHTPKSLKNGSGMASWKQFLLSLLATTVSIVLTFGTAAIIDNNKKEKEKNEIVMMVMYDMYNTLQTIQEVDSNIREAIQLQRELAEDTTKFDMKMKVRMSLLLPINDFTKTTERIFSTSIETINTVGNVFFTENVADFYQGREYYEKMVCDSAMHIFQNNPPFLTAKSTLEFSFIDYAVIGNEFFFSMQQLFSQCKEMMDVSDEEIETYQKEREKIKNSYPIDNETREKRQQEIRRLADELQAAKKKLNLE